MSMLSSVNSTIQNRLTIRKAGFASPFSWLSRGWRDLWQHPRVSLAYGGIISAMGVVILLFASTHIYLIATAISGFLLAGPFLAIGLCELSRRQEQGQSLSFDDSLSVFNSNKAALAYFSAALLIISILWFILSSLVVLALFGDVAPSIKDTLWGDFLNMVSHQQLLLYLLIGGILACVVFALSVVSIPVIIDSHATAQEAILLSIQVVIINLPIMIIWASLIVALTAIGFMSYLLGMIIIYPLLGHATWHAYRDLIEVKG